MDIVGAGGSPNLMALRFECASLAAPSASRRLCAHPMTWLPSAGRCRCRIRVNAVSGARATLSFPSGVTLSTMDGGRTFRWSASPLAQGSGAASVGDDGGRSRGCGGGGGSDGGALGAAVTAASADDFGAASSIRAGDGKWHKIVLQLSHRHHTAMPGGVVRVVCREDSAPVRAHDGTEWSAQVPTSTDGTRVAWEVGLWGVGSTLDLYMCDLKVRNELGFAVVLWSSDSRYGADVGHGWAGAEGGADSSGRPVPDALAALPGGRAVANGRADSRDIWLLAIQEARRPAAVTAAEDAGEGKKGKGKLKSEMESGLGASTPTSKRLLADGLANDVRRQAAAGGAVPAAGPGLGSAQGARRGGSEDDHAERLVPAPVADGTMRTVAAGSTIWARELAVAVQVGATAGDDASSDGASAGSEGPA